MEERRNAAVWSAVRVLLDVLLQQSAASDRLAKQLERCVARAQAGAGLELDVWEERLGCGMTADAVLRDLFDVDVSHASGPPAATERRVEQQPEQYEPDAQSGPLLVVVGRPGAPATGLPACESTKGEIRAPCRPFIS